MQYPRVPVQRAFTLVELLVVVAILAVLAALLLPVLAQVRESGRRTGCLSNLRQFGVALQLYVDDHEGRYPVPPLTANEEEEDEGEEEEEAGDEGVGSDWEEVLHAYLRNKPIFRCPSDPSPTEFFEMSYAFNGAFAAGMPESAVRYPAQTIAVADRRNSLANESRPEIFLWWQWQEGIWPPRALPDPAPAATRELALDRHAGRLCFLYVDGHVRCDRFAATWGEGSANQYWPDRP